MKKIISTILAIALMAGFTTTFAAQNELNPDTSSWFVYEFPKAADVAGTALDASNILDAPAGKHGFLTETDGQRFVFEDGTKIRFNGVNVSLALPYADYEHSKEMAQRIAQSGYNIVRFHLVESGYRESIWGRKADGSRVLKEEIMDRMCFFMSELKKRGVYYLLDLTISAPPVADLPFGELSNLEDLNAGFKGYSYFNENLKQITKDIAAAMLNFYNPYTGLRIKDDPALALMDIKNEDFINTNASSEYFGSDVYEAELQAMFNEWLRKKYGNEEALKQAWSRNIDPDKSYAPLYEGESLANGTIRVFHDDLAAWDEPKLPEVRQIDRAEFLDKVQKDYFAEMTDFLRNDLGVKCRITGVTAFTTTGRNMQILYSNVETDFIDHHTYSALGTEHNFIDGMTMDKWEAPTMTDGKYGIVGVCLAFNTYGMPHTITEWNQSAPDRYRAESMVLMPAFSSLNSMHPFAFCWACGNEQMDYMNITTDNFVKTSLGFGEAPETLAGMPNAARMFVREDIKEANKGYYPMRLVGKEPHIYDHGLHYNTEQFLLIKAAGLVGKTGLVFDDKYEGPDSEYSVNSNDVLYRAKQGRRTGEYLSVTGEILSNTNTNIVKVNTEKTQAVTGSISGQTIELSDIKVTVDNPYATVSYSAVENKPLYKSGSNLLTVLGDSRNTGAVYEHTSDGRIVMTEAGTAPVLVEPITGTVVIKTNNNITVYPLSSSGKRGTPKAVTAVADGKSFKMEASDKAMHYEIVTENPTSASQIAPVSLGDTRMPDLYTDIAGNAYEREIETVALYSDTWTSGGKAFNPSNQVSKRDFCTWLIRGLRLYENDRRISKEDLDADDMSKSAQGYTEMAICYTLGAVDVEVKDFFLWKNTYVRPDDGLTKRAALEIASKVIQRTHRNKTANSDHTAFMLDNGYVDNLNNLDSALSRAEAARIIYNVMWAK